MQTIAPAGAASAQAFGQPTVTRASGTLFGHHWTFGDTPGHGAVLYTPAHVLVSPFPYGNGTPSALGHLAAPSEIPLPHHVGRFPPYRRGGYANWTYAGRTYAGRYHTPLLPPAGIASGELFGRPTVGGTSSGASMVGAASAGAAGQPNQLAQGTHPADTASSGGLGSPQVSFAQSVAPRGAVSSEAFGPAHVAVSVFPTSAASALVFGAPALIQTQYINAQSGPAGFAAGLYSTSLTVPMSGLASGAQLGPVRTSITIRLGGVATTSTFGNPEVALAVPIGAVPSGEQFGLYRTSVTLPIAGFTDEQFGRPPPLAQKTRPMLALASAEAAGQPVVGDYKLIGSAVSAEAGGQPRVLPGPVFVNMLGEVLTVFGRPSINVTVLLQGVPSLEGVSQVLPVRAQHHDMQGLASSEAWGQPSIPFHINPATSAEAFGRPLVSVALTVRMQGAASAETFGGPYVGSIISMQGIPTGESVTALPIVPVGIHSGFAAGGFTFYVPPQDQTVRVGGADSDEAFGGWRAISAVRTMQAAASAGAFGPVHTAPQLRMAGIASSQAFGPLHVVTAVIQIWFTASAEAVGLPSFPSPQTVHMGTGAPSGATFGNLNWTFGIITYPIGASTGEDIGRVTFSYGGVSRTMQGKTSDQQISPLHYAQTALIGGAASSEAVGQPSLVQSVSPLGVPSAQAVGRPDRPSVGALPVSMAGTASAERFGNFLLPIVMQGAASSQNAGLPTAVHSATFQGAPSSSAFGRPMVAQTQSIGSVDSAEAFGEPATELSVPPIGTQSGEAFGDPHIAFTQFLDPAGADTAEQAGSPYTIVTVRVAGAVSLEGEGIPRVALVSYLSPASVGPAETVNGPKVNVTVPMAGAASAAAFGGGAVLPGELRLTPWGITEYPFEPHSPHDKYGEPKITTWVLGGTLAGVPTAEHVGAPRQAAQGAHPAGIGSAEGTGRPAAPNQTTHPAGAASAEHVDPFWQTALAVRTLAAVASSEAAGRPRIPSQAVHLIGIAAGQPGAPRVNVTQKPQGAASSFAAGIPTVVQYLRPSAAASSSAAGLPNPPAQSPHVSSIAAGSSFGLVSTSLTVPIAPAGTGESTGRPAWAGEYRIPAGPAAPGETWGGPGISTVVRIGLVGTESLEAAGDPSWFATLAVLLQGDEMGAVGLFWWSKYPSTGVTLDTSLSGQAQMLTVNGRSLSVDVLVVEQGIVLGPALVAGGGILLGDTLPMGTAPVNILSGSGVGVRYTGTAELDPASVVFTVDGTTVPADELLYWHEDTETFGPPYVGVDIYWVTPVTFPAGTHTASVAVADINGVTDQITWLFTSTEFGGSIT